MASDASEIETARDQLEDSSSSGSSEPDLSSQLIPGDFVWTKQSDGSWWLARYLEFPEEWGAAPEGTEYVRVQMIGRTSKFGGGPNKNEFLWNRSSVQKTVKDATDAPIAAANAYKGESIPVELGTN